MTPSANRYVGCRSHLKPNESGPPSVPRSRITPFCQMKACVGAPRNENGSGEVLMVENPTTTPELLTLGSIAFQSLAQRPDVDDCSFFPKYTVELWAKRLKATRPVERINFRSGGTSRDPPPRIDGACTTD